MMADFYRSKEFKKLSQAWRKRLKEDGFEDIENAKNIPKQFSSHDSEETRNTFIQLDHFLYYYPDMPRQERRVMELYSNSVMVKDIMRRISRSRSTVQRIIKRYKSLLIAINRMTLETDFALMLRGSEDSPRKGYSDFTPTDKD